MKTIQLIKVTTCLCTLFLSAGHNLHAESAIIAKIGNEEIATDAVRPYLDSLDGRERAALEKNPALLTQMVRTLILQQVLFKEAVASGWDKQPSVMQQLDRVRQAALAESYLQTITKVPDNYPTEADIKAIYDLRKDSMIVPRQFRVAEIFIALPKGGDKAQIDKTQSRVDAISKNLRQSGVDFAAIARAQSEEPESASKGGEIGWVSESSLQPDIRKALDSLAKNAISEPVRSDEGWFIVKVLDIKEPHTATLDEVKSQLTQLLRNERIRKNREAYLARLQQQNPMAINELALSKLLEPGKK